MEYVLLVVVEIALLLISFILACNVVRKGIIAVGKDSEETKEKIKKTTGRIKDVLEEEARKLSNLYKVTAVICNGEVTYISVLTDKTEGIAEKSKDEMKTSLRSIAHSERGAVIFVTIYNFIILSLLAILIYFTIFQK